MSIRILTALAALLVPAVASAQHGGGGGAQANVPPPEAGQFDFLIGQWELTVRVPASGLAQRLHGAPKLAGTWKAWRAFDGWGVEDELRIVDGSGNPLALSHTLRVYDRVERRWSATALDAYRARFTSGTAEWREGEMRASGTGADSQGRAYVSRTRFYDITPKAFKMVQDRSSDGGKTWTEGALRVEATRVAAAAAR